jgi:hypothetical protein
MPVYKWPTQEFLKLTATGHKRTALLNWIISSGSEIVQITGMIHFD